MWQLSYFGSLRLCGTLSVLQAFSVFDGYFHTPGFQLLSAYRLRFKSIGAYSCATGLLQALCGAVLIMEAVQVQTIRLVTRRIFGPVLFLLAKSVI